jgi:hypothetical protein
MSDRGELSGLSDLPSWLTRMREIAAMPDSEALPAVDVLLWSVQEITEAGPEAEEDWDAALARELETRWIRTLLDAETRLLTTHASALRLMADVDTALRGLAGKLTQEQEAQAQAAKERAARWRSDKRLADADVAQAGGNEKRATRLRAEAREMLKQDEARAFPGEPIASG